MNEPHEIGTITYDEWLQMNFSDRVQALDTGRINVDIVASFPYADKSPEEIARVRERMRREPPG